MLRYGVELDFYFVTLCFPAIIIAVVVIALYLKERNKKL